MKIDIGRRIRTASRGLVAAVAVTLVACSGGAPATTKPVTPPPSTVAPGTAAPSTQAPTSAPATTGTAVKIALLLPDSAVPRYEEQDRPNFTNHLAEICPTCQLIYFNANADAQNQLSQVQSAITQGAQALVVNPVDSRAAAGIADAAKTANVPLVSLGRLIQNGPVTWSVSVKIAQAGTDKAEQLAEALAAQGHPTGPIVMINGAPGDTDDAQMKEAAKAVFTAKGITIAKEFDTPDWSPEKAQQEMDQAITALGADGFYGVYSSNDGMAGGIIASMTSANIDPSTRPVTGLDADMAALQRIVAGTQYMTEYQDLKDQDEAAAEVAYALALGQTPDAKFSSATVNNGWGDIPTYQARLAPINQTNLKTELIDTGFIDPAKLCVEPYASACTELGITP
jgi:D-xylose transport system substrate-binding protein